MVEQQAHVAAAAYLMKHAGTTALMVLDSEAGQPTGIITEADITRAVADGMDVNTRPAALPGPGHRWITFGPTRPGQPDGAIDLRRVWGQIRHTTESAEESLPLAW